MKDAFKDYEVLREEWIRGGGMVHPDILKAPASDTQVGGDHYTRLAVQPWDAMAAWMSPEQFAGYLRGNVIKYLAREKNGVEDLQKAQHYLSKLIEVSK